MLNLKFSIKAELQSIRYPIQFNGRNICVHCGAEGSLTFVDAFGKETNKEIHAFDHLKCKNCGRNYSILWQTDPVNNKMFPTAVAPSIKQEFLNIVNKPKEFDN